MATEEDWDEARKHLEIAIYELTNDLPKTQDELVEKLREYFEDQQVDVFSRVIVSGGEDEFRDFILEVAKRSGYYDYDNGQLHPIS